MTKPKKDPTSDIAEAVNVLAAKVDPLTGLFHRLDDNVSRLELEEKPGDIDDDDRRHLESVADLGPTKIALVDGITHVHGTLYLVPWTALDVAENMTPDEKEYRWHNIRYLSGDELVGDPGFSKHNMLWLRKSIERSGLLYPLLCRWVVKGQARTAQLVDGERRLRNIDYLVREGTEVYDAATGEMVSARRLYEKIPCQIYDLKDHEALLLAARANFSQVPPSQPNLRHRLQTLGCDPELIDRINPDLISVAQQR